MNSPTGKRPAYQERPGRGTLHAEVKKSPTSPDWRGYLILDQDYKAGDKIKLAAWMKTIGHDTNVVSLGIDNWKPDPNWKPGEKPPKPRDSRPGGRVELEMPDSDLPF